MNKIIKSIKKQPKRKSKRLPRNLDQTRASLEQNGKKRDLLPLFKLEKENRMRRGLFRILKGFTQKKLQIKTMLN